MFWKKAEKYKIIEVEKASKLPEMSTELKESLKALALHPGFQYLLLKMRYERSLLESYLRDGFQLGEQALHHLQAGVHYLRYIDDEMKRLTSIPRPTQAEPEPDVADLFRQIQADTEQIGQ